MPYVYIPNNTHRCGMPKNTPVVGSVWQCDSKLDDMRPCGQRWILTEELDYGGGLSTMRLVWKVLRPWHFVWWRRR